MNMVMDSFERANGFSVLTADELFFVNGGSGTSGLEAFASAEMAGLGVMLIGGAIAAGPGGIIMGLVGAGVVLMSADMLTGNGLDVTIGVINKALGK
ncbi:MAG: hypothetical protein LBL45_11835 [Treponema sp.]|jgi:hypothetical protein|nr:hypothetical protein [Treponema sp.]